MQPCASANKYINMNITHCTYGELIYGMCEYEPVYASAYSSSQYEFFFVFFFFICSFIQFFFCFFSFHSVTRYAVILMHAFYKLKKHTHKVLSTHRSMHTLC